MRKCKNWLSTYMKYIEDTETPRHFWFWSGLFTLAAALERKVYLPFMRGGIFPNLYVLFIAPPGKCRKGEPIKLSKKLLHDLDISVYADSATRRAMTSAMAELTKIQSFNAPNGRLIHHSSFAVASSEFSTFLMTNMKEMIELLTDLWDCADKLKHNTFGCGEDKIENIYVNLLGATTPVWLGDNLPQVIQGGGFLSRCIPLSADRKHKWISNPKPPSDTLYKALLHDLKHINSLMGRFRWTRETEAFYDEWYRSLELKLELVKDQRVCGYMERFHIQMLKVAMLLRISCSDDLVFDIGDLEAAIRLMDNVIDYLPKTLSGHGRNPLTANLEEVMVQLRQAKEIRFSELMTLNYTNCSVTIMNEIIATLMAMRKIEIVEGKDKLIKWKGKLKKSEYQD